MIFRNREIEFFRRAQREDPDPQARSASTTLVDAPYPTEVQEARLSRGWSFFTLQNAGDMVSFAWARVAPRQSVSEIGAIVDAGRPVVWIIDCITPMEHRGRGYYPRLIRSVAALLEHDEVMIYCETRNHASSSGIRKAGFTPIGTVRRRWGRLNRSPGFPLSVE